MPGTQWRDTVTTCAVLFVNNVLSPVRQLEGHKSYALFVLFDGLMRQGRTKVPAFPRPHVLLVVYFVPSSTQRDLLACASPVAVIHLGRGREGWRFSVEGGKKLNAVKCSYIDVTVFLRVRVCMWT